MNQREDPGLAKAMAEANRLFGRMGELVESAVADGAVQLDVLEIVREVGLEIDIEVLHELRIPRICYCHPWLHWCCWWPWRPLWCWWWRRYHPWYRCCPYWWHRCHWYPA